MEITEAEHIPGSGHSCLWHWRKAGDIGVAGTGGRVLFKPVTDVILSFYIKHSANWKWTGLTMTASSGQGKEIKLDDASYFMDGWGIIQGDSIQLEGHSRGGHS